jgi:hypothetical protein
MAKNAIPGDATPGRPKESGSRQQTHPNQNSSSGSPSFDKEATKGGASPPRSPPDQAK